MYDPLDPSDGFRVLVDRLWPRGFTKEKLHADLWLKEAAPSSELREWFHHDPSLREEFIARYFAELDRQPEVVARLLDQAAAGPLTLLYAARDRDFNQAVVLAEFLRLKAPAGE